MESTQLDAAYGIKITSAFIAVLSIHISDGTRSSVIGKWLKLEESWETGMDP